MRSHAGGSDKSDRRPGSPAPSPPGMFTAPAPGSCRITLNRTTLRPRLHQATPSLNGGGRRRDQQVSRSRCRGYCRHKIARVGIIKNQLVVIVARLVSVGGSEERSSSTDLREWRPDPDFDSVGWRSGRVEAGQLPTGPAALQSAVDARFRCPRRITVHEPARTPIRQRSWRDSTLTVTATMTRWLHGGVSIDFPGRTIRRSRGRPVKTDTFIFVSDQRNASTERRTSASRAREQPARDAAASSSFVYLSAAEGLLAGPITTGS